MILEAEGISRKFLRNGRDRRYVSALCQTDFKLEEGRFTEIVGRSGSGKSTFLNIIAGILQPDTGCVHVGKQDLYQMQDQQRSLFRNEHIGMIPQGQTGRKNLSVLENVTLPCELYGIAGSEKYALELLDRVGIVELAEEKPENLSGGEMRRLAIARALIRAPRILLADEPTGDLDDVSTHQVLELLKELTYEGTSVVVVTHDVEVSKYSDIKYRMDSGMLARI
jgi:putative ABC transport system ATP-binding protein